MLRLAMSRVSLQQRTTYFLISGGALLEASTTESKLSLSRLKKQTYLSVASNSWSAIAHMLVTTMPFCRE